MSTPTPSLEAGQAALAGGDWTGAREAFEALLAVAEQAEALEGLGWALWWLDRPADSFEVRQRAYRCFVERGDARGAARVATALAIDIYDYQGEAVCSGWMESARRHLEGQPPWPEHGWFALWDGHMTRLARGDLEASRRSGGEALRLARELGIRDLELLAIGLEGHALVSEGRVDEGMRRLDEATAAAIAGEISDLDAAGAACCFLMHACEQVRDYDRAAQWADRVAEFSRRWRIRPLYAICRVHYAGVLIGSGAWNEAEAELRRTLDELGPQMSPARSEGLLFLGELRRRQGRVEEAQASFAKVEGMSLSLFGRAAIAFDAGDGDEAAALLDRALRRAAPDNWTVRTLVLSLLTRVKLSLGATEDAARTLETLQTIADLVGTPFARASARHAAATWMRSRGEIDGATRALEDAIDLFRESPAPFESALARLDLAETLATAGRAESAQRECRVATDALETLGATAAFHRARTLATELGAGAGSSEPGHETRGPLSPREAEILSLVAEGLGDREIAGRLHLSEHTVHRHVANVMLKLDVPSRTAAVAQALRRGLI